MSGIGRVYRVEEKKRGRLRKASHEQKLCLVYYLEQHTELVNDIKYHAPDATFNKTELWDDITETLNSLDGAKKDSTKWRKFWTDLKGYTRGRYAALTERQKQSNLNLNEVRQLKPLTQLEQRIINLLDSYDNGQTLLKPPQERYLNFFETSNQSDPLSTIQENLTNNTTIKKDQIKRKKNLKSYKDNDDDVLLAQCTNSSEPFRVESVSYLHTNPKKPKNHVKSNTVLALAYDLLKKESENNEKTLQQDLARENTENGNLSSFAKFIDSELQKLDEHSLAIAKMEIHEILYKASLGIYKNADLKTDKNIEDLNKVFIDEEGMKDDNDEVMQTYENSHRQREKSPSIGGGRDNKENHAPPFTSQQKQDDEYQKNRVRKKRIKSKEILSGVYDILKTEISNKITTADSFGTYVCNELKAMDYESMKYAKLNICRVLCDAVIGKYKKSVNDTKQTQEFEEEDDDELEILSTTVKV